MKNARIKCVIDRALTLVITMKWLAPAESSSESSPRDNRFHCDRVGLELSSHSLSMNQSRQTMCGNKTMSHGWTYIQYYIKVTSQIPNRSIIVVRKSQSGVCGRRSDPHLNSEVCFNIKYLSVLCHHRHTCDTERQQSRQLVPLKTQTSNRIWRASW